VKDKREMLNKDLVTGVGSGSPDAVIQTLSGRADVDGSGGLELKQEARCVR